MDLNYLKKVIKIFDESALAEIKIEEEGLKIKLSKSTSVGFANAPQIVNIDSAKQAFEANPEPKEQVTSSTPAESKKDEDTLVGHVIKSPIVGTFYRASSPDSEPFVEVGGRITKGSALCIIEAMKLMNEIESDITGTVTKILVENGQAVEYGQPLFVIKTD